MNLEVNIKPYPYSWSLLNKNAEDMEFISTCSSLFEKHSYLERREMNDLRVLMNSFLQDRQKRKGSFLNSFIKENPSVLKLLLFFFKASDLSINMIQRDLMNARSINQKITHEFSEELLRLCKVNFNKSIYIGKQTAYEARTLVSEILLDLSETIVEKAQELQRISKKMSALILPTENEPSINAIYLDLSVSLGFDGIQASPFSQIFLQNLLLEWVKECKEMGDHCREFTQLVDSPRNWDETLVIEKAHYEISQCYLRMHSILCPRSERLVDWEGYRQSIRETIDQCNQLLFQIFALIPTAIEKSLTEQKTPLLTHQTIRKIKRELINQGKPVDGAEQAVCELIAYLQKHHITPAEIIPEELKTIHSLLTPEITRYLKPQDIKNLNIGEESTKKNNLTRLEKLEAFVSAIGRSTGSILASVLITAGFFGGCGVKSNPKSSLLDTRPSAPFEEFEFAKPPAEAPPQKAITKKSSNHKR